MRPALALVFLVFAVMCSPGQSKQSDREIDGYRGAVKRALTERSDLTSRKGKIVESKRRPAEDTEYDRSGNRSRQLSYDYASGVLRETAIYTTIDGDKVVTFEQGPGALVGLIEGAPVGMTQKRSDPRYDFKFKYKYDRDGRVSEEAWWQSNGDLWLRYVFAYDRNEKNELVFDADGKLNQKYRHKFDTKGNIVETTIFDTDTDKPSEEIVYKYLAFDSMGNWTKRVESAGDEESRFKKAPREMMYRKIVYYERSKTQ